MIAKTKETKCLVPGCQNPVGMTRGVCQSCYTNARRLIFEGKASWEDLERMGLVAPRKTTRGSRCSMMLAFEAAMDRKQPQQRKKAATAK